MKYFVLFSWIFFQLTPKQTFGHIIIQDLRKLNETEKCLDSANSNVRSLHKGNILFFTFAKFHELFYICIQIVSRKIKGKS